MCIILCWCMECWFLCGACMIASASVCVSVRIGFASSTECMMDAPSELPKEVRPFEKFV